eukprot:COSAG01_NODE_10028_length_2271_cov_3.372468_2_plen_108_part_00
MGLFTVNNIAEGTNFVTMDSPKFVCHGDEDVPWHAWHEDVVLNISLPLGQFPPDATVWSVLNDHGWIDCNVRTNNLFDHLPLWYALVALYALYVIYVITFFWTAGTA